MQRVLITGAAGRIGGHLRPRLAADGRVLRLLDVDDVPDPVDGEEVVTGSVLDAELLREACRDVDAVVHLAAATGEPMAFDAAADDIAATHLVLETARQAGIPRVVYASSNHAVGFHPRDGGEAPDWLFPRPDTFYGVAKVASEALGSMYVDRHGMDVVCLRIGTCRDEPIDVRSLSTWLSPDDTGRLVEAALTVPSPGFAVVWGVSANTRNWWSLDAARALGYEPRDDAERYAEQVLAEHGEPDPDDPGQRLVGGSFTT
ncbi:NAD-dependent epimerase/dehydratase family protein [Egicoccus halophilus]|uniref:NAD-dependent dehydratase n=1 Tax=Egicoccus halophilus TaxID=1670830 RepID=A0A8J3A7W0_9ACTN|nr:NAD(P)-dependent oxidoreductase [Egicoccus halophilus]GGI04165.1 NAD-dependent dehydratase [Egicoccus halophilus]